MGAAGGVWLGSTALAHAVHVSDVPDFDGVARRATARAVALARLCFGAGLCQRYGGGVCADRRDRGAHRFGFAKLFAKSVGAARFCGVVGVARVVYVRRVSNPNVGALAVVVAGQNPRQKWILGRVHHGRSFSLDRIAVCDCAAGGLDQLHRANGAGSAWWVGVVGFGLWHGCAVAVAGRRLGTMVAEVGRVDDAREKPHRRDDAGRRGVGGAAGLG